MPPSLMQKCQPLDKLEGMTGEHLIKNITSNAEVYWQCSDMHDKLIEAVQSQQKK